VGPAGHSTGLRGRIRSTFLGSSSIHPTLSVTHKRLPRTGTARRKRMPGVRGLACEVYLSCWSDFPLQGVYRFESP
jgi:hypothetical protein